MPVYRLFDIFRYLVFVFVTIYTAVVIAQSLWGYYVWLRATDRYTSMLRRYIILHGLRLRFRRFAPDVLIILLQYYVFYLFWQAHQQISELASVLESLPAD